MAFDEYRYLTFLYYDLVDSTPLSQQLDAERWHDLLRSFQSVCMDIVARHGGETHDHRGDGSLAYFGFPSTHRISALQAIRAGLALVTEKPSPFADINRQLARTGLDPLQVRVGIHSGRVVIGSMGGRQMATGYALAFAERLQGCAAPNTVVIGEATRRLIGERFALENLGERVLKGVERPAQCHRVLAERDDLDVPLTSFVGRQKELAWLAREWRAAGSGLLRFLLIAGEAGIGKSRLVDAFGQTLQTSGVHRWVLRCLPDIQHNALHPVVGALRRFLRRPALRAVGDPLTLLEMLLPPDVDKARAVPAIAPLLGLSCSPKYPDPFPSAEARREVALDTIVAVLVHSSRTRPLLLVIEDTHWIDRATCQILERLSERRDCGPLAVILLQRTDETQGLSLSLPARTLELGRLDTSSARRLVQSVLDGQSVDDAHIERLIERSDGVPLFIEESVFLQIDGGQQGSPVEPADGAVDASGALPPRLMDLLNERLDRVDDARETAGLAAAIGREFPLSLLQAASTLAPDVMQQHVTRLVDSGLVVRQRVENDTMCHFKHALVRDSAYALLLDSRRRAYHERIAEALEQHGWQDAAASPDRLASHYAAAQRVERAIELWIRAGLDACKRSEHGEALSHLLNAQQLVENDPAAIDSLPAGTLLTLHLTLLRCHVALEGYSCDAARDQADLAERHALESGAVLPLITARFAQVSWLFTRGQVDAALTLATECLQTAEAALAAAGSDADGKTRNRLSLMVARARWACGNIEFHLARFDQALPRIHDCIRTFTASTTSIRHMDHDPLVMCLCYRAWHEWESGDADAAVNTVAEAVKRADANGHSFAIALSLSFQAALDLFRGEHEKACARAAESIAISRRSSYATWLGWALVVHGRARCELAPERKAGIADIEEGLCIWADNHAVITRPFMLAQLAEACVLDGQLARAQAAIEEARVIVESTGDRYYEVVICQIEAVLPLAAKTPATSSTVVAGTSDRLRTAIRLAEQRGQHASALKAVITLCSLEADAQSAQEPNTGVRAGARVDSPSEASAALLETALARMSSGRDTADQRAARKLLRELEPSVSVTG